MTRSLETILQECTVKITIPQRSGWGTGFFVAPGLMLTCAHVVRNATDRHVDIYWPREDVIYSAEIIEAVSSEKASDVVLLRLSQPTIPDHPCVYLDESIEVRGENHRINDPLFSYGYLKDYPEAAGVTVDSEWYTGDSPPLIKFKGGEIQGGLSGGALLNLRTAKVIGIVKETRSNNFPKGGGAITVSTVYQSFSYLLDLRSLQKEYHTRNTIWIKRLSQSQLDEGLYKESESLNEDLYSEIGVDYTKLQNLLKSNKWKESDIETSYIFSRVLNDNLSYNALLSFPRTDLLTINNLWLKYSQGKFGFSVQKQIYIQCGGKLNDTHANPDVWERFCKKLGWKRDSRYLNYSEIYSMSEIWPNIECLGLLPYACFPPDIKDRESIMNTVVSVPAHIGVFLGAWHLLRRQGYERDASIASRTARIALLTHRHL